MIKIDVLTIFYLTLLINQKKVPLTFPARNSNILTATLSTDCNL